MTPIQAPYPMFFDKDGSPLTGGYVFFGQEGENPRTSPITVYWDEAGTQPATNLRTLNGYIARAGSPTVVYIDTVFSLLVVNARGEQVFYSRSIRTNIERLRQVYPQDYGAAGDGVTDDTAEVQAAINATAGRELVFPKRSTYLCGPLTIPSGTTLRIDGTLKMRDVTGVFMNVTAPSGFVMAGTGVIDLNNSALKGIRIANSVNPVIEGAITIKNMLGTADTVGNAGAIEIIGCTKPRIRGLRIENILHGAAPGDSQPRAVTLDTSTEADLEFDVFGSNSGIVAAACTDTLVRSTMWGGGVVNDNAAYIINCTNTTLTLNINEWDGEPIVDSGSTGTCVLGGSQINCIGNSNGIENVTNFSMIGTVIRGPNVAGVLRSRSTNTSSNGVQLSNLVIDVKSSQEVVSFFTGVVNDFRYTNNHTTVTYDTGLGFGSRFMRLVSTDRFQIEDNTWIFEEGAAAPAADYSLDLNCSAYSTFKGNSLVNRTAAGRFRVNGLTANVAADRLHRQSNIDGARDPSYLIGAEPSEFVGTAVPTAGTYKAGDFIRNTGPTAGTVWGWVCVEAGTPGKWEELGGRYVMPETFGADPTGVADSAAALQAAITAAGSGELRLRRNATYRVTTAPVVSASNLRIVGNGATINGSAIAAAGAMDSVYGLKVEGSIGSNVAITVDATEGAVALTVASTTGLAANDLLLVYSTTEKYPEGATGATNLKGALHRVRSVDSGTALTLVDGLFFNLTAASGANFRKLTPVENVTIENLRVVMGGINKAHNGIRVKYAVDCWLRNCKTRDTEDIGVRFDHAFGGGVSGGDFSYANSPADGTSGVTGVTGYGLCAATATRNVIFENASLRGCRHAVSGGGTYPSFYTTVRGCNVDGGRSAAYAVNYALDCHEDCVGWVFDGNTVSGANTATGTAGIVVRGQKTRVVNNTIIASAIHGILLQNFDTGGSYSIGAEVSGNVIISPRQRGISVGGTSTTPWSFVTISDNIIENPGDTAGIYASVLTNATISGNQIKCGAAANVSGVYLAGTAASTGSRCESVAVVGNTVNAPGSFGIRGLYADGMTVAGNHVIASGGNAVNLVNCNEVTVTGDKLQVSASTASGVYIDATTKVAVSGVVAENTVAPAGASVGVRMVNATSDVAVTGGVYSNFATGVLSAAPADYITVAGVNARNCTASVNVAASANTAVAANL